MNKQEAIEKVKEHGEFYSNMFGGTAKMVPVGPIIDIISQIDEPQKVVLPKEVAEWLEECRDRGCPLRATMIHVNLPEKVNAWFSETSQDEFTYPNQDIFARAWLDGFEIEQEKLYTVELFNGQPLVEANNVLYFNSNLDALNASVSKDKLEQAGFGWVFDCDGVKVVEVE